MSGVLQLLGALTVLIAFVGVQTGRMSPASALSLLLNTTGAALLAGLALAGAEWGFFLLEATWAVVSLSGLIRVTAAARRTVDPG